MEERLQKILSREGLGSRRACEVIIDSGQVTVNGAIARLGQKADPETDRIEVKGKVIKPKTRENLYIALNKPKGVLSDRSADDPRQSVYDLVPIDQHLFAVGRLDYNSQGLVLMTSDGDLAFRLTHPRFMHEKEYLVLLQGKPEESQLEILKRGVVLSDGYRTRPAVVNVYKQEGKNTWIKIILREGKKRQIREMCGRIGLQLLELTRIRIGTLELMNLKPKEWRYLSTQEVQTLKSYVYKN